MTQLSLPMLTVYEGPRLIDFNDVSQCKTYREAVRLCHFSRLRTRMTNRALAEESGVYPSHLTDYLSDDETKRELPAKHIAAFEVSCGNRAISQWLASQANLTILEQFIQPQRKAA